MPKIINHSLFFHLFLFVITFLSVTYRDNLFLGILLFDKTTLWEIMLSELPYSLSLMFILFGHEMGHYLTAKFYGIKCTLPYFIPFPFGPIGTMGAVIRIQETIKNKKQLFDIGIGGPLVSFILSIICWIIGLFLSELVPLNTIKINQNILYFGDSFFTYLSAQIIFGGFDSNSFDIFIHPLAKAGWVGLLVTAINLLPFGQLDGGHVIYSIFGEKYRNWIYYLFSVFLLICLINYSWIVWALIIFYYIKVEHPFIPDYPLDSTRKKLGIFMLCSLLFIFIPSPIMIGKEANEPIFAVELWNYLKNFF